MCVFMRSKVFVLVLFCSSNFYKVNFWLGRCVVQFAKVISEGEKLVLNANIKVFLYTKYIKNDSYLFRSIKRSLLRISSWLWQIYLYPRTIMHKLHIKKNTLISDLDHVETIIVIIQLKVAVFFFSVIGNSVFIY